VLHDICVAHEDSFVAYGERVRVDQEAPNDFYYFKDNGSRILAVAHLDSCEGNIMCSIAQTADGPIVFSGALDDRLGAYVILDMLPRLGVTCDWLLTTGEETGRSTADYFVPPLDEHGDPKQYDWIIQFDRGGTDVVMYDYETAALVAAVRETGVLVGQGSFSDICKLEHLGCKAFNWGVGYQDYHGPRAHAWLDDTFYMVEAFLYFYGKHVGEYMPHVEVFSSDPYRYYEDYKNDRYDGLIILKGDRTKPSGRVETVDYEDEWDSDDKDKLDDWLERHQVGLTTDRDPSNVCLGCMEPLTPDAFCLNCDEWR
jgi:hypothetical protein